MQLSEAITGYQIVNFNQNFNQNTAEITATYKLVVNPKYVWATDDNGYNAGIMKLIDSTYLPKIGAQPAIIPTTYKNAYFVLTRMRPFLITENEIRTLYMECTYQAEGLNYLSVNSSDYKCRMIDFHRDTTDYELQTDKAFAGNDDFSNDTNYTKNTDRSVPITNSASDALQDGLAVVKPMTTMQLTFMVPQSYFDTSLLDKYDCSINSKEITICGKKIQSHAGFMTVKNITALNSHSSSNTGFLKFILEIRVKQGNNGSSGWGNLTPPDTWDKWPLDQGFRVRKTSDSKLYPITNGMVKTGSISDTTDETPVNDPVRLLNGTIHPSVYDPTQKDKAVWLYYRVQRQYEWGVDQKIYFPSQITGGS